MKWTDDIQYLKGVGPKRAAQFARLGVATLGDLLRLYPRGYIDYSQPVAVAAAPYDMPCVVRAEVLAKAGSVRISGGRTMLRVACADESAALTLVFFNNPYVADKLEVGKTYLFYGKVGGGFASREMIAPSFLPDGADTPLTPVYPLTEGLSNPVVARCAEAALAAADAVPEPLPEALLAKYKMPGLSEALRMIHRPKTMAEAEQARRRLIFEELFELQLGMLLMRGRDVAETGAPMRAVPMDGFVAGLPFALTGAQARALGEIAGDMAQKTPMNRLLQGDVGSGKTLVAAGGVWLAAQNGYQSVLMAPTEILARQHADTLDAVLGPLGV
ncbi:MAG: DEAD/DEAH box helicase, partial [Oscillospiraceae bacterium]